MNFKNRLKSWVKNADMYGAPISLKYKGKQTYKTLVGGIATIFFRAIILAFFMYGLVDVYNQKSSTNRKTFYKDPFVDDSKVSLNLEVFDVGVGFNIYGIDPQPILENPLRYYKIDWF